MFNIKNIKKTRDRGLFLFDGSKWDRINLLMHSLVFVKCILV